MSEKRPFQNGQESLPAAGTQAPPRLLLPNRRRAEAWWGGMMAGIAIGAGLAVVMHVMEKLSPSSAANCGVGCGYGISGGVVLVMFLGPIIGLGLGMGFAAAVPETTAKAGRPQDG
jgi:hypothetical protein